MTQNITRFVLLFEGRTGSTFIMNALDSHPQVISQGEILVRQTADEQEATIRALFDQTGEGIHWPPRYPTGPIIIHRRAYNAHRLQLDEHSL